MTNEMKQIQTYLQSKYGEANVSLRIFPSGVTMLDLRIKGLLFSLEYSPEEGFGVSRVEKDEDAEDPEKYVTFGKGEFDKARDYFLSLISETDL